MTATRDEALAAPYFTEEWWVSPMNFAPEAYPARIQEQSIYIHDVTLRDGEQSPGVAFKADERIRIAEALDDVGVHRIEVGMPIVSPGVFDAIKRIVALGLRTEVVPQARAEIDDVDRTMETGASAIIIVHTINPLHCRHVFGLDTEAIIDHQHDRRAREAAGSENRVHGLRRLSHTAGADSSHLRPGGERVAPGRDGAHRYGRCRAPRGRCGS